MKLLGALFVATLFIINPLNAYFGLSTLTEDFDDGDYKGWVAQRLGWEVVAGELRTSETGNPTQISSPLGSVSDFEMEFDIRYDGSGYGGGCYFRSVGDGRHIQWIYDALAGNLLLSWSYDGDSEILYERSVDVDNNWHTMKVRMIGSNITVWWEGQIEATAQVSDPRFSEGHLTLIGKGPNPLVAYDNVRITVEMCVPR